MRHFNTLLALSKLASVVPVAVLALGGTSAAALSDARKVCVDIVIGAEVIGVDMHAEITSALPSAVASRPVRRSEVERIMVSVSRDSGMQVPPDVGRAVISMTVAFVPVCRTACRDGAARREPASGQ